jgi:hypothetical protein
MAGEKKGRGRPALFTGNALKHLVALAKQFNASVALAMLRKEWQGTKLGKISMPTVLKLAKANGVKLHRGRPVGSVKTAKPKAKPVRKTVKAKVAPVAIAPVAQVEAPAPQATEPAAV